ncbi:hypothetical protein D4R71_05150 [bacterium]|nr:hypothetical protein [Candidatus Celaenobacter polaris]TSA25517.1 MAG: hypothetical protein D4R71_05150 [bacterium]
MKKSIKFTLWLAGISGILYWCYWIYKVTKAEKELTKATPKYIENIFGEKPAYFWNIVVTFPKVIKISLTLKKCSKIFLEKESEVESVICDYIKEYYPLLRKAKVEIKFEEMESE